MDPEEGWDSKEGDVQGLCRDGVLPSENQGSGARRIVIDGPGESPSVCSPSWKHPALGSDKTRFRSCQNQDQDEAFEGGEGISVLLVFNTQMVTEVRQGEDRSDRQTPGSPCAWQPLAVAFLRCLWDGEATHWSCCLPLHFSLTRGRAVLRASPQPWEAHGSSVQILAPSLTCRGTSDTEKSSRLPTRSSGADKAE